MAIPISSTEILGARLLREVAAEEGSLEDLLKELRTTHPFQASRTGLPELEDLWKQHGGKLAIAGRSYALVYHLIDHMVTGLNGAVALVDMDGRFSPSHLSCDIRHVHVWRPTNHNLSATLESVEGHMLWGDHVSKGREWVGTIVNGGVGGDIMVGWRGWLKVEKEDTGPFGLGVSVEEVMVDREQRQEVVDRSGWKAVSEIGEFSWR